jgi:predicted ATPase with chaperone activity
LIQSARVEWARKRQLEFRGCINAQLDNSAVKKCYGLTKTDMELFEAASELHTLSSGRALDGWLRLQHPPELRIIDAPVHVNGVIL